MEFLLRQGAPLVITSLREVVPADAVAVGVILDWCRSPRRSAQTTPTTSACPAAAAAMAPTKHGHLTVVWLHIEVVSKGSCVLCARNRYCLGWGVSAAATAATTLGTGILVVTRVRTASVKCVEVLTTAADSNPPSLHVTDEIRICATLGRSSCVLSFAAPPLGAVRFGTTTVEIVSAANDRRFLDLVERIHNRLGRTFGNTPSSASTFGGA